MFFCMLSANAADELRGRMFIHSPQDKPLFDTNPNGANAQKSRLRYWPCNGYVSPKLLNLIYEDLVVLSKAEGMQSPDNNDNVCRFSIYDSDGPNRSQVHTVNMYPSTSIMESCIRNPSEPCDSRSASFRVSKDGKELHLSYNLVDVKRLIFRSACGSMNGQVIKAKEACD